MEYTYIMGFISWMMMFLMLSGFTLVTILEEDLKKPYLEDEERLKTEAFLMPFWEGNFFSKVNFITLHGARLWAIILGDKFQRKG